MAPSSSLTTNLSTLPCRQQLLLASSAPAAISTLPSSTTDLKTRQLSQMLASMVRQTDFMSDCFLAPHSLGKQTASSCKTDEGRSESTSTLPSSSDSSSLSHIASIASNGTVTFASRTQAYHLQMSPSDNPCPEQLSNHTTDNKEELHSPTASELQTTSLLFEGFEVHPSGSGLVRASSRRLNVRHETQLRILSSSPSPSCSSSSSSSSRLSHRPKSMRHTFPLLSSEKKSFSFSSNSSDNKATFSRSKIPLWLSMMQQQQQQELLKSRSSFQIDSDSVINIERITTIQLLDEMDPSRPAVSIEMCESSTL